MRRGVAALRVRTLARALGVTLGSFYWHFESLADFKSRLFEYWRVELTERFIRDASASTDDPAEQLLNLMTALDDSRAGRYEAAMRAWAAHEEEAAKRVEEVDRARLDYVTATFGRLGFRGLERELRVRLFLHYQLAEPQVLIEASPARRRALRKLRHAFLTSPAWPSA